MSKWNDKYGVEHPEAFCPAWYFKFGEIKGLMYDLKKRGLLA